MITDFLVKGIGYSRFGLFTLESLPVILSRLVLAPTKTQVRPPDDHIEHVQRDLKAMLQEDSDNVQAGVYPFSLLSPESPRKHFFRYQRLLWDSVFSSFRVRNRKTKAL